MDDNLNPATSSTYIQWVVKDKLGMSDNDWKKYNFLINTLSKIEFIWIHPRDENRAVDGLSLRESFTYETGLYLDGSSGLPTKCSVFEMLAALAIKIENQIMRNLSLGDRTSKWFLEMCYNLGFKDCTNKKWKYDDEKFVQNSCKKFIFRDFKSDGDGGLFPMRGNSSKNWRDEEIWVQCMAYLRENYPNDDPGLALYS